MIAINSKLDNKLFEQFNEMFLPLPERADPTANLMCFGFECGDGWYIVIHQALSRLRMEGWGKEEYQYIMQVKEKFGGLRIYITTGTDEVFKIIEYAEERSLITCEECGEPGSMHSNGGWLRTLCPKCADKYDYFPAHEVEENDGI